MEGCCAYKGVHMSSDIKKSVSFMRSLCMGQIEEDVIVPFPKIKDSERQILKVQFCPVGLS